MKSVPIRSGLSGTASGAYFRSDGRRVARIASLAVLPIVNFGSDKECFRDGWAEELMNTLTQLPGLRVMARTSAFAFRARSRTSAGSGPSSTLRTSSSPWPSSSSSG